MGIDSRVGTVWDMLFRMYYTFKLNLGFSLFFHVLIFGAGARAR